MAGVRATVVVPTYKEKENLHELITRVFAGLQGTPWESAVEMVIVDDNSADGSQEVVEECRAAGHNVRIIVRTTERGLSSAVLCGFDACAASTTLLLCMDADLQHPPESVPMVLDTMSAGYDFVIGTRYVGAAAKQTSLRATS